MFCMGGLYSGIVAYRMHHTCSRAQTHLIFFVALNHSHIVDCDYY